MDFTKMEWDKVDERKAEFFYKEAVAHNNGLIEDIRSLNNKAFRLLSFAMALFIAAFGFLLSIWGGNNTDNLSVFVLLAGGGFFIALLLLLVCIFPRYIYLSEDTPESYFTGNFYKQDFKRLYSFGIASLNKYINYNYAVMRFRRCFLILAIIVLMITPLVTIAGYLIHHRNP
jgi:hypothetical protein